VIHITSYKTEETSERVIANRPNKVPSLGLVFTDKTAAKKIINYWIERLGVKDENEELRIAVIQGVDAKNPHYYRVVLGSSTEGYEKSSKHQQVLFMTRFLQLDATDPENLNMFLKAFRDKKKYYLVATVMGDGEPYPAAVSDQFIVKSKIIVKQAWEISENDFDISCLFSTDNPVIPNGVTNPPVIKALKRARKKGSE